MGRAAAVVALLLGMACCGSALLPSRVPKQFAATLEVTSKHLNKTNVYPPAWRTIDVEYDWLGRRGRAYVHTSYEKRQKTNGTTTIRRYDLGKEWEISQFGKVMVCKWSRILNAKMPRPTFLSTTAELVGTVDRTDVTGLTQLEPKDKALAAKTWQPRVGCQQLAAGFFTFLGNLHIYFFKISQEKLAGDLAGFLY